MLQAIVLAGGYGKRLRNILPNIPKPMAPIAGKPFLEILLMHLSKKGFKKVVISLGYQAHKIKSYFGNKYLNLNISYVLEDKPLGTGGATRLALNEFTQDPVYVFNGDTFVNFKISEIQMKWQKFKETIILAKEVKDTSRYGRLITNGDLVIGFSEKKNNSKGLINCGCYVFSKSELDSFSLMEPFSLETEYLSKFVTQRNFRFIITKGQFIDIGVPESYKKAQSELLTAVKK